MGSAFGKEPLTFPDRVRLTVEACQAGTIVIDLGTLQTIGRIEVFEAAVGRSWEKYEVSLSREGEKFTPIGRTEKGSRGKTNKVSFEFEGQKARFVKLSTEGCQDLTFPSFSRLCEVMVFGP